MSGLGSRTTETGQRIRDFLAKARKEHYWNEAHVAMYDLNELEDRCVRAEEALDAARRDGLVAVEVAEQRRERLAAAEEALRQAERLIIEHHKVGVFEGFHIGDTCPVCAEFQSPLGGCCSRGGQDAMSDDTFGEAMEVRAQAAEAEVERLVVRLRAAEQVVEAAQKAWDEIASEVGVEDEARWFMEVLDPVREALEVWAGENKPA